MNLKFIHEGISKRILFSFLTVIQFTIAIICIYISVQFISDVAKKVSDVNKQFGNDKYYKFDNTMAIDKLFVSDEEIVENNINVLQDMKRYIDNNKNISFISCNSDAIFVKKEQVMQAALLDYQVLKFDNVDYMRTQGGYVNKLFLEKMNYKFIEGGIENFNVKSHSKTPVIVGSTYKEKYSVGDEITASIKNSDGEYKEEQVVIVGILSDDSYINFGGLYLDNQSLKNTILLPYNDALLMKNINESNLKNSQRLYLSQYISGGYVILKDDKIFNEINNYFINSGLKFQLIDFNNAIEKYKKESIDGFKPILYIASMIIIFSIISVIIVMVNAISKEKKEYGINIMLGATMRDIKIRMLGQIITLLGVSFFISIGILKNFEIFRFNINHLMVTIYVLIIIVMIIAKIIIAKLNKYSINDLVRRSE